MVSWYLILFYSPYSIRHKNFDNNIWYKKFYEGGNEELDRIIKVDLKGSALIKSSYSGYATKY